MQLYVVLTILVMTLSTAYGLVCFKCATSNRPSCIGIEVCSGSNDRCFSISVAGLVTKGCKNRFLCLIPNSCCETDLCNSAIPTGPSVVLLLVSSAIITLFL
ncbi:lymphocyte antigen 6G-like [Seriola aureovittata]|uniref:lymphocyte antigen 6G-like n=1 Tax=Seriola aureovittata TaxID=2871759 RepID=UPI0024BECE6B|nr:lymphocyte antigen 6G-like [Seriola aureovittata]